MQTVFCLGYKTLCFLLVLTSCGAWVTRLIVLVRFLCRLRLLGLVSFTFPVLCTFVLLCALCVCLQRAIDAASVSTARASREQASFIVTTTATTIIIGPVNNGDIDLP